MKKIISIEGMACEHCAASVKSALEKLEDVKSAKVDLKKKSATVKLDNDVADDVLKSSVTEAGFTPVSVIEK
jgi:copper chaperone CopZ